MIGTTAVSYTLFKKGHFFWLRPHNMKTIPKLSNYNFLDTSTSASTIARKPIVGFNILSNPRKV